MVSAKFLSLSEFSFGVKGRENIVLESKDPF